MSARGLEASDGSFLRVSPGRLPRARGSVGELIEFAEQMEGSKQLVRQEPAQDPCGYGLLPVPPTVLLPLSASASSGSTPTGAGGGGTLLSPPCSSPELLDQHAPVGSGSSDGGGSQPGTASSRASSTGLLGGGFPLGPSPPAAAAPAAAGGGAGLQRGSDALPLPPPRVVQLVGGGFSASREPGSPWGAAAAVAAAPKLSPSPSRRSLLGALELPEGEVLSAVPSRSVVDEVDFIHLSLTPIRTRAASQEQGECSPPVAYADSLAPAPVDACCGGGLAAKAAPGGRPTIHIIATSASLSAAPGAYNPYDRSALAGGGGYGGGRSYGFNYGAAPTGPPTSSSGACYWASHQQRQHHGAPQQAGAAQQAAPTGPDLPGPAAEQGCWPAAAPPAPTAAATRLPKAPAMPAAQPEPAAVEEVEHIVMVPGMRRKHSAPAPPPAAPAPASAAPRPCPLRGLAAAAAAPPAPGAAAVPATEEKGTWTSPAISALGAAGCAGAPRAEEHVHGSCAAASALAAGAAADGGRAAAAEGGNLLKQMLKGALMVGAAVAAAAASGKG